MPLTMLYGMDIGVFGGLTGSSIYNEKIKEGGGGPIGLTVRSGFYHRFDGYIGLRVERGNWHVSAEAGALLYGNLEKSRFSMKMDGLDNRMDIEGSNVDPISFGMSFGTDKRIKKDFYLQTLGGISTDRGSNNRQTYLSVSVKYLFPLMRNAQVYRELQDKYLYSSEERFNMPRRELLLDKNTGWAREHAEIEPDIEAEERIEKRSEGKNRMVVHILTENENGDVGWTSSEVEKFEKDSESVSPDMMKTVKEKMSSLDKNKTGISRVRIVRYGHYIDEQETAVAKRAAENVYEEMTLYKEELEILNKEKIKKEEAERLKKEADRLRKETDKQKRLSAKEEKLAQQITEAQERREEAIVAFRIKAATFQAGRAILSKNVHNALDMVVEKIKSEEYNMVTVEGHTDSTGSEEINMKLSQERAQVVYNELLKRGIPKDKLNIVPFGSAMPIDTNETDAGRAANRRVEIFVE